MFCRWLDSMGSTAAYRARTTEEKADAKLKAEGVKAEDTGLQHSTQPFGVISNALKVQEGLILQTIFWKMQVTNRDSAGRSLDILPLCDTESEC